MQTRFSSPALVLRHLDYGEADRIVSCYTPEHGRIKVFARNARASRKRFGGVLEPFASVTLAVTRRPRSELLGLEAADLRRQRPGLVTRLAAFALASYAVDLVELLLEEGQPLPDLFVLLEALLDHLDEGGAVATARLLFELRLVQLLGWVPHLGHCSLCYGSLGEKSARFAVAAGGALCTSCAADTGMTVAAGSLGSMARCLRTPLSAFAGIQLGEVTLREGERVLQQVLAQHWTRPPRSLPFLLEVAGREP